MILGLDSGVHAFQAHYDFPLTRPLVPVLSIVLYLAALGFSDLNKRKSKGEPNAWLSRLVLLHNIVMCQFSLLVFLGSTPGTVLQLLQQPSLRDALCDGMQNEFVSGLLGFWTWVFYISKYYEFVDTMIVVCKGHRPSFLQKFHHAFAVVAMWLLVVSRNPGSWLFVNANSFVHFVMYGYYALTSLKVRVGWKHWITLLQIAQFLFGMAVIYLYHQLDCFDPTQRVAMKFNLAYISALTLLFVNFAWHTYAKKSA